MVSCNGNKSQESSAPLIHNTKQTRTNPKLCGSAPIIKDKNKIEQSLRSKGTITPEMSQQESDALVKEFIQKKNAQYQRCIKGNK
jgi:hypothetical protein